MLGKWTGKANSEHMWTENFTKTDDLLEMEVIVKHCIVIMDLYLILDKDYFAASKLIFECSDDNRDTNGRKPNWMRRGTQLGINAFMFKI